MSSKDKKFVELDEYIYHNNLVSKIINTKLLKFKFYKNKKNIQKYYVTKLENNMDIKNRLGTIPKTFNFIEYKLELEEESILCKIFIENPPKIGFKIKIAMKENGPYLTVYDRINFEKGIFKTLNFKYLPCKYIFFITKNLKTNFEEGKIKCFGYQRFLIEDESGEDGKNIADVLFNSSSKILFHEPETKEIKEDKMKEKEKPRQMLEDVYDLNNI